MTRSKRASLLILKDDLFKQQTAEAPHPVERFIGPVDGGADADQGKAYLLPVDRIQPDPNQSRKTFSEESIASLAASIQEKGLLQPISVRRTKDGFVLVAGERRWRAHQKAGIPKIWAFIVNVDDPNEAFEISLVENLQREDLNPFEEAAGIAELMKRRGYRQKDVTQVIGRSRSQVSELLKLNRLPGEVRKKVLTSELSRDHLFRIADQETPEAMLSLYDRIVQMGLNVRETRQAAKGKETDQKHPLIVRVDRFERFLTKIETTELDQLAKEDRQALSAHLDALVQRVSEMQQRLGRRG